MEEGLKRCEVVLCKENGPYPYQFLCTMTSIKPNKWVSLAALALNSAVVNTPASRRTVPDSTYRCTTERIPEYHHAILERKVPCAAVTAKVVYFMWMAAASTSTMNLVLPLKIEPIEVSVSFSPMLVLRTVLCNNEPRVCWSLCPN